MAYSSHIISKIYNLDSLINSVEQARRKFKKEFKKCASSYNQFKHTVLFVNIIDKVFVSKRSATTYLLKLLVLC